jgi:hypothetical protein
MYRLIFVIFFVLVCSIGVSLAQIPTPTPPGIDRQSFFDATAKWDSVWQGGASITRVPVCWENPDPQFSNEMNLVKQAAQDSWQAASSLQFTGWVKCAMENAGIRILIDDSGPHVKELGDRLDRMKNGMVLNFTFNNWSPSCKESISVRTLCIKSIAVHEFGHAIGFAHEQNRADAPGECQALAQGDSRNAIPLTPYDPNSVMNYCNVVYNNNGILSGFDIEGVQKIYGKPISASPIIKSKKKSRN